MVYPPQYNIKAEPAGSFHGNHLMRLDIPPGTNAPAAATFEGKKEKDSD